jgi:hypothetical protein
MVISAAGPFEVRHDGPAEPVVRLRAGDTVLLPAALRNATLHASAPCAWLEITLPVA